MFLYSKFQAFLNWSFKSSLRLIIFQFLHIHSFPFYYYLWFNRAAAELKIKNNFTKSDDETSRTPPPSFLSRKFQLWSKLGSTLGIKTRRRVREVKRSKKWLLELSQEGRACASFWWQRKVGRALQSRTNWCVWQRGRKLGSFDKPKNWFVICKNVFESKIIVPSLILTVLLFTLKQIVK